MTDRQTERVFKRVRRRDREQGRETFLPFLGNNDRPTYQQMDMRVHREVTLPMRLQIVQKIYF